MPDPQKHADSRGWIETIARYIPGFSGYLEKEYRRESDQLARKWMADRLDQSKSSLATYVKNLTAEGKLAELTPCQSFATRLDTVVGKFRSAPAGYSGFFDFVQVSDTVLEKIYNHDVGLFRDVEELAEKIEGLSIISESPSLALKPLEQDLTDLSRSFDNRHKILAGIAE